jgi:hypothetical protein
LYQNPTTTDPWSDPLINALKQVANIVFERDRRTFKVIHSATVQKVFSIPTSGLILVKENGTKVIEYHGTYFQTIDRGALNRVYCFICVAELLPNNRRI